MNSLISVCEHFFCDYINKSLQVYVLHIRVRPKKQNKQTKKLWEILSAYLLRYNFFPHRALIGCVINCLTPPCSLILTFHIFVLHCLFDHFYNLYFSSLILILYIFLVNTFFKILILVICDFSVLVYLVLFKIWSKFFFFSLMFPVIFKLGLYFLDIKQLLIVLDSCAWKIPISENFRELLL